MKTAFSQIVKNVAYVEISNKVFQLKDTFLRLRENRLKEQKLVQEVWQMDGKKFKAQVQKHKEKLEELKKKY